MFTSETLIRERMIRNISDEECERALDIALRVEKQITCHLNGKVLDSRTAKALYHGAQCVAVLHPDETDNQVVVDLISEKGLHMVDATDVWEKISG